MLKVLGLAGLFAVLGLVGNMQAEDELLQMENYCQMVELHTQTDGVQGWPDYAEAYDLECKDR